MNINIPGINADKAIKNSGSKALFIELLGDTYKLMERKLELVESCLSQKDLIILTSVTK